ncbi:MAG: efflux RND transporter periplasmic adaptor subunit [Erysipelotrichaceae bacterium]|nr:efflux RND transporter periplasmic adaptor subunit [Erysipelotrichaceae bacterium]
MNSKIAKILILLAMVTGVGYGGFAYLSSKNNAKIPTETFKETVVKKGDISISFDSEGTSNLSVLTLKFPVSGVLTEIKIEPGSYVHIGETLAVLDNKNALGKLETARLNYQQALIKLEKTKEQYSLSLISEKAKLETLKYQMENTERDYTSMAAIPETFSALDIEAKMAAYGNAKTSYESSLSSYLILSKGSRDIELDRLSVQQAAVAIKDAERDLSDTVLTSPIEGKVLAINAKSGEMVNSATELFLISDASGLAITSLVSELDVATVEIGQRVELEFEALEGQIFKGQVLSIDPLAKTNASGLVNYTVRIEMDEPSDKIMDGMSCNVSYILRKKEDILIIPNASVKMFDGKQTVEVKTETGDLVARQVSTGLTDGFNVEVIQGLESGEVVIIRQK